MSPALFISHHRRVLLLCAATALLHALVINYIGPRLGLSVPETDPAAPPAIVAQLRSAPPPSVAPAAPAAPNPPAPKRHARKRPAPPTVSEGGPASGTAAGPAPESADTAALANSANSADQPTQRGDALVADDVVLADPAPVPAPALAPLPAPRRLYKASLPPPAEITMALQRTDADGKLWHGEAVIGWQREGQRYRMKAEAGIRLLARINLLVVTSEGALGEDGFAPLTMTERRAGRSLTATHFDRSGERITFSASSASVPLLPGTQDKATLPFQLAAIGRADPGQFSGGVTVLVGEDKDASVFQFELVGQETIATGMGRLGTWHLSRPPRPGAYNSHLEVWLAPSYDWMPVQLRNTESSGAITIQTASKIVVSTIAKDRN
ncbi:MAG: DUF3108 domain-containing protein [Massilia sp.]